MTMAEGKPKILCIDDDEDVLVSLRLVLEQNGYAMIEAATAEEGLEKFKAENPALVIVDLMMEEVDAGASFVKEVKAIGGDVPIYMLSSVGDQLNLSADYASLGLAGVFQKPIHPQTLLKTLKNKVG
jgi:two-component system alkaline phosphatase synthesis response regulator PhoP